MNTYISTILISFFSFSLSAMEAILPTTKNLSTIEYNKIINQEKTFQDSYKTGVPIYHFFCLPCDIYKLTNSSDPFLNHIAIQRRNAFIRGLKLGCFFGSLGIVTSIILSI